MLSFPVMKTTLRIMKECSVPSSHALCYPQHLHLGYFHTLLIRPPASTLAFFNLFPSEELSLSYQNKSPIMSLSAQNPQRVPVSLRVNAKILPRAHEAP